MKDKKAVYRITEDKNIVIEAGNVLSTPLYEKKENREKATPTSVGQSRNMNLLGFTTFFQVWPEPVLSINMDWAWKFVTLSSLSLPLF